MVDCPTCAAVAQGGRIRLTPEGAELLDDLLRRARADNLVSRRKFIKMGDVGKVALDQTNVDIRRIDTLLEEIARTQDERGWKEAANGQHFGPDSEGAGSRLPDGAPRPVG